MKKTWILSLLLANTFLLLTGCGKGTPELDSYKASVETFFKNIAYVNDEMNELDGSSDEDVDKLLGYLDTLDEQFKQFADLKVPSQFENVDDLADEASENMSMAVSYYHQAYEGESFSQNYADAAYEYYGRANLRINYIIKILHGEKITDGNVVYEGDENSDSESQDEENQDE